MEFSQLRALEAIAAKGSFLAAASHLGQSQSSLSHAIAALESELDARLLERGRYGAKPTDLGRRVLPHVRQILSLMETVRSESAGSAGIVSGKVRIGSIPSATVSFLPKVIARYVRAFPEVDVVLLEDPSQGTKTLRRWLSERTIDIAIVQLPAPDMKTMPLIVDELCAILPLTSEFARTRRVSLRDVGEQPLIMSRYTSEVLLNAAYARHNLKQNIRFEVQDRDTLISMVREGLGFSIVPRLAFSGKMSSVKLVPLIEPIYRQLGLATRLREPLSAAVEGFAHTAAKMMAKSTRKVSAPRSGSLDG